MLLAMHVLRGEGAGCLRQETTLREKTRPIRARRVKSPFCHFTLGGATLQQGNNFGSTATTPRTTTYPRTQLPFLLAEFRSSICEERIFGPCWLFRLF